MIQDVFKSQIEANRPIVKEILDKAINKKVWSGKEVVVGDKMLYALVYQKGTDDLKAITFLERELNEIATKFNFLGYYNNLELPILTFRDDKKIRNVENNNSN